MLHLVTDDEDPYGIVAGLRDTLAPGSYLVITHAADEYQEDRLRSTVEIYDQATSPFVIRTRGEIERLFAGFELVDPGVVALHEWWPDSRASADDAAAGRLGLGGVGRKAT